VHRQITNTLKVIIDLYDGDNGTQISCYRLLKGKKGQAARLKVNLSHIDFIINQLDFPCTLLILVFHCVQRIK